MATTISNCPPSETVRRDAVDEARFAFSAYSWLYFGVALVFAVVTFREGLAYMENAWSLRDEYSHGYMIPMISLFLVWQKSDRLARMEFTGSWAGVGILVLGLLFFVLGEMSTLYTIIQYAFLVVVVGMTLACTGWNAFKVVAVPVLFLVFMIPLPDFFYNNLSLKLQLISSSLGVDIIRACNISVFLEGNVIDLGTYKLQVVEACNGLRYLFPFMSLSFLCAYLYQGAMWKRVIIVLSSLPVSVLMNSFRIGMIGVLVEYFGQGAAEGFIHDFEGWAVFMICMLLLVLEMHVLARIGNPRRSLGDVFYLALPAPTPPGTQFRKRVVPVAAWTGLALLGLSMLLPEVLSRPVEQAPERVEFLNFPLEIGAWKGRPGSIEQAYLDVLKLDDYLLADFSDGVSPGINYYIAYYASQSKGRSIHSPRSCLPGGGWVVTNLEPKKINFGGRGESEVARVLIQQGENRQLVYFWTQQRGRIINNEYLVKWYLFWDALTRHRTDGALVRLTTRIGPMESIEDADRRLGEFVEVSVPLTENYIPD